MKTIAYSEVPESPPSYVHLAYLSANSEPAGIALAAILIAIPYLLLHVVGSATKLNLKFPKVWHLMTLTVVTVVGFLLVLALLSPTLGR